MVATSLKFFARYLICVPIFLWGLISGLFEWLIPSIFLRKDVKEDVVLITGAGSGLGRAIALEYAKLGSSLVLWDLNQTGLSETKSQVEEEYRKRSDEEQRKGVCLSYVVDVSDKTLVERFSKIVLADLNSQRKEGEPESYVSVLVNNAGIYYGLNLMDLTDAQIERIFKINVLAHFWTVRAFLPKMMEHQKGHIVEIASMGGLMALNKQVDYCATKFATVGFEESLSIELDTLGLGDKIHTTVVCPYFFNSNLFTGYNSSESPLMTSEFVAKETVNAMRCNYSRIMLPQLMGYPLYLVKSIMPRSANLRMTRAMKFAKSIEHIKGATVDSQS